MDYKVYSTELAGATITVEIGRFGEQANGACTVRCGDTVVFVSATGSKEPREGIDFFPLTVILKKTMVENSGSSLNRRVQQKSYTNI